VTRRDEQIRRILHEIESGSATSHRCISARADLSLGLTNQLLRSLLRRGFVRVVRSPANRRQYVLTRLGLDEQARIAREYREMAVGFYATVRDSIRGRFEELSREWPSNGDEKRIVLYGSGDLAEIAYACAQNTDLKVVGVVDDMPSPSCCGCPVEPAERLVAGTVFDGVVVVTSHDSATIRTRLEALGVPAARVRWL
jgi:DNA-binding MarR family transcriptional regulator